MEPLKLDPALFFAALADPTRLRLLQMLACQPEGGAMCVNALALRLGVSQPAVSQHLQVLRNVGLVYPIRRGVRVHYYLDRKRLLAWQQLTQGLFAATDGTCERACDATIKVTPAGAPQ
jgi:ArsR family transcriptional regulator